MKLIPTFLCTKNDHQIYDAGKDLANVKSSLSRNAEKASKWYQDSMLKGNYGKYKTMTMQNKRGITNPTMSIQGNITTLDKPAVLLGEEVVRVVVSEMLHGGKKVESDKMQLGTPSVELHGKDSMTKALISSSTSDLQCH